MMQRAYVLVDIQPTPKRSTQSVIEQIRGLGVSTYGLYGNHDAIAVVDSEDDKTRAKTIDGIRRVVTPGKANAYISMNPKPRKDNPHTYAFVGITTSDRTERTVDEIREIESIISADILLGYKKVVLAQVAAKDQAEYINALDKLTKILGLSSPQDTDTLVVDQTV